MNDFESIWTRIMAHSNHIVLATKRGQELRYEIKNNMGFIGFQWKPPRLRFILSREMKFENV
jgi:hypothetical protein